jgi:methylaspartate ammonia-lyase
VKYADGSEIEPGDLVQIDTRHRGTVIASMDTSRYLPGHDLWAYLGVGIMIDTDFGGLVHYTPDSTEQLVLLSRNPAEFGRKTT